MVSRYWRFALVALVALSMLASSVTRAAPSTYTDPQNRFSILALDGFHAQTNPNPPTVVGFITNQIVGTGYNVEVEDEMTNIGPTGTLDDLVPFALKNLAVHAGERWRATGHPRWA